MAETLHFDDVVPEFSAIIRDVFGKKSLQEGLIFRDAFGKVGFCSKNNITEEIKRSVQRAISGRLGAWAHNEGTPIDPEDFAHKRLMSAPARWEDIDIGEEERVTVRLADRRIVGQDWVTAPLPAATESPRRLVFWSAKGGGGRTTALCVLAAALAQDGFNVLVIDADLEAPGLGTLLLRKDELPRFGLLDYLAETGIVDWDETDLGSCLGVSYLTDMANNQGLIHVVPAIGTATLKTPQNMIAKLSRAFLEKPTEDDGPMAVRDQLRQFVDIMAQRRAYDAILIDARAGLSEFSASTLLGLRASVLAFATEQAQSYQDMSFMFAHLSGLDHAEPTPDALDWRHQFHFIQAKAEREEDNLVAFQTGLHGVLSKHFYEAEAEEDDVEVTDSGESFSFSLQDEDAPHRSAHIYFDANYKKFDPVQNVTLMRKEAYQSSFESYLDRARTILGL
ncbi:MAG TPA: AAA family ATPase [Kaistia sp.]|jgi:Mrp family chromosome partitioning ATPase|nr:AAA family ATPase [Kaistia sp.]